MPQAPSLKELEQSLYEKEKPQLPPQEPDEGFVIGPTDPVTPLSPNGNGSDEGDYSNGISRFGRRRFLMWLGVIIFFAVVASVLIFWRGFFGFSKSGVEISIEAPDKISGAEEVVWKVSLLNSNRTELEGGELVFNFPKNSFNPETGSLVIRENKNIGKLDPGQKLDLEFSALVLGGDNFIRKAGALFSFQPSGSRLTLGREAEHELLIEEFPVSVEVASPVETLSGQNIKVSFSLENNSEQSFDNLRLRLEYPSGFRFLSSTEDLSDFNTLWEFKEILSGETRENKIEGVVSGSDGEGKIFRAFLEYREAGGWQKYKEASFRSDLANSPLSLSLRLAEERNNSVDLGDRLNYEITWRNNFDIPLSGLDLSVKLDGSLYDFSTLSTNGTFNLSNSTIFWSGAQVPLLNVLRPNESGVVTFRIEAKSVFTGETNPTLGLSARLDSQTKPAGLTVDSLFVLDELETKVNGSLALISRAFYNDPSGLISNSGPYPLRVGQDTTFTVHWGLSSFANNFEDVRIKAILPSGVSWVEDIRLPGGLGEIEYNPSTREVIWSLDSISANKGLAQPIEAIFKIKVNPSPAQEGSAVSILSETELIARDGFTGNRVEDAEKFLDSSIREDVAGSPSAGRVQP